MTKLRFEFRPYARQFQRPLQTHHGEWSVRQGVILCLMDPEGRQGWGEIAPIVEFGSEDWATTMRFCQESPAEVDGDWIQQIPDSLPACQFGFEAAWEQLQQGFSDEEPVGDPPACGTPLDKRGRGASQSTKQELTLADRQSITPLQKGGRGDLQSSILLPTGAAALESPLLFTAKPGSTFKWKIGVGPIEQELNCLEELLSLLPSQAKLRLDANGGLDWQQASLWLQVCDGYGIEFLEQPLPPQQFELMQKLSQRYITPIALDESVAHLQQLRDCYQAGWRGLFVIKAAIAGSPRLLRQFCQTHHLDVVWSSVFETNVARQFIQDFLVSSMPAARAIGFGVDQWFNDGWERLSAQQLWQRLERL